METPSRLPEKIWDRWPNEGRARYAHFRTYLGIPVVARSLKATAAACGLGYETVRKYSKREGGRPTWKERAQAYDAASNHYVEEAVSETRADAIKAHAEIWAKVRTLAVRSIQGRIDRGEELTADQALRYAEIATKYERLALGAVTDRRALDLTRASDEELASLEGLVGALASR